MLKKENSFFDFFPHRIQIDLFILKIHIFSTEKHDLVFTFYKNSSYIME